MANKSFTDEVQKKGKSAVKKGAKKAVKNTAKEVKKEWKNSGEPKKNNRYKRKTVYKILPYFLIVFALVLALCFIIVHVAELDDGAGLVGYYIQWFFGGLLGGASALLPVALGFFGIRWCLYNIKWKEEDMSPSSEYFAEYRKAKRRMIVQGVMAFLVILTISVMFGVVADYGAIDIEEMWTDSAETVFEGGGVVGSTLGCLMVMAFEGLISMIILGILLTVFVIFMVGLTPDYIIEKFRERQELRREEREYLAELERDAEEQRRLERQKQAREQAQARAVNSAVLTEQPKKEDKTAKQLSAEEILDLGDGASVSGTASGQEPDIYIGPAKDEKKKDQKKEKAAEEESADPVSELLRDDQEPVTEGKDYGGEPGFDTEEYGNLADLFQNLKAPAAAKEPPRSPEEDKSDVELNLSEIGTEELLSDVAAVSPDESYEEALHEEEEEEEMMTPYVFPPIDMLAKNKNSEEQDYTAELQENARQLLSTLQSFKINIKEINYSRGPTITRYELRPEAGVRVRSIANLVDDIALSLATSGVRIEAPIPGKPAVGIEVPNRNRATVYLRDLIDNGQFTDAKSKLTCSLGMDVGGNPIYFDVTKMPHMIIAGATGMGKSVCINCIIISILYKAKPQDVKLILIDPKKVEFNLYKDIPHLYAPIVSDPKKVAGALASAVAEMERRFELIEEVGVRDIASYNAATENDPCKEHMPHMVIIIDELADLMMTAPDEVESSICRLAQKARAAGIHIIIGTQRPSVDVITGLIKANIPSRIACTVASQVDSRTIIDIAGAEKLIGRGDMLFAPVGAAKPMRVQGAFVTETEVENICTFIRENNSKA